MTSRFVACAALLATLALAPVSQAGAAEFGVQGFDGKVSADASGTPLTQAGGHPYSLSTQINFSTEPKVEPLLGQVDWPVEPTKDVLTDTPPGLAGNPTGMAKCSMDELAYDQANSSALGPLCSPSSQVGTVFVVVPGGDPSVSTVPLFNLVPPPNAPARFGFNVLGTIVTADAALRSGSDYGVSVNVRNASEGLALDGARLTFWGVPSDPSHDSQRSCAGKDVPVALGGGGPSCPTDAPRTPFLRLPTSCPANPSQGLPFTTHVDSWWHPGRQNADGSADLTDPSWQSATFATHLPPGLSDAPFPGLPADQWGAPQGLTGCDALPFDPVFEVQPSVTASPAASGYAFDLAVPQSDDPNVPGESDVKSTSVTLPAGMRVNPAAAHGLEACSPAQISLHSSADPTCPDASKVGTVTIDTPLLDQQVVGSLYLATPHDNPSHSLIAIYLVAKAPGVIVKLAGGVKQDATSGRMTAAFENLPQLPFTRVHLEFFGGQNAPLSNPPRCGTYTTRAVLTSWSGKTVESDSSFTTSHDGHGAPCPAPQFNPTFSAGTTSPIAGRFSPLSVTIGRSDDDQEIAGVDSIQMPDGLLAKIKGVKLCKGADARAGSCAEASRIGTVTAAAGTGPDPFAVSGKVYFGGRYKHAPFSLDFVIPVKAGPFDLGTVNVRAAAGVDKHDATLKVTADPLPTILQGIPLQVRLVNVTIDRRKFVINPTSCAEKRIGAAIRSTGGLVAHVHDRFAVTNCAALGFAPKLALKVGGKGHVRKHAATPLTTTLTMPPGGANLKSVSVSLPLALSARLDVVNNACTQAQFDAGHCDQARAGTATAITPLLPHALRGGVFFVKDPDKPAGSLPNLVVALRGQVDFDLVSRISIPQGTRLATRFGTIPDVPVSKFTLSFVAGAKGPLAVAESLCSPKARREQVAITFRAQNGRVLSVRTPLDVAGCHRRHARR